MMITLPERFPGDERPKVRYRGKWRYVLIRRPRDHMTSGKAARIKASHQLSPIRDAIERHRVNRYLGSAHLYVYDTRGDEAVLMDRVDV